MNRTYNIFEAAWLLNDRSPETLPANRLAILPSDSGSYK